MPTRKYELVQKIRSEKCVIDCHTHVGVDYKSYLNFGYPYCMSFEDLVIRMKYLGIDHAVVMPFESSYYKLKPDNPKKVEMCNYYIRKYFDINGKLVDFSLKSSFDTEMKIVKNLGSDEIEKITYKNPIRFLFE